MEFFNCLALAVVAVAISVAFYREQAAALVRWHFERAMSLCLSRHNDVQRNAFVESPVLRWSSLPRHDYIQRLIERFRQRSSPECTPHVVFNPDEIRFDCVSASFHLPGAYVECFPCPHCSPKDEEDRTSLVEVFHFPNVHESNVCATVTFVMPASLYRLTEPGGCSVQVEITNGYPNAPVSVDRSPRAVPHMVTDVCIEVFRFLPRSELEKTMLVSRRWSNIIGWSVGSLQQRRSFSVLINVRRKWLTLRLLATRGLPQALEVVRSHLRNAFVEGVMPLFPDSVPPPGPPRAMLVDIPFAARVDWFTSLLRSMPPNSEVGAWCVGDTAAGLGNLPALASCALVPHRRLGRVNALAITLIDSDATWAQLASLLHDPGIRGFSEIVISDTRVAIDTSELRAILSSWRSLKLSLTVSSEVESQDALLTMPAHLIRDFLSLRDASSFVDEFRLHLEEPNNVAFPEMPHVHSATDRRKRFRHHVRGEDTVVRVTVYANRAARQCLTVVTFDEFRRTVLFLKGDVSLADLKSALKRYENISLD